LTHGRDDEMIILCAFTTSASLLLFPSSFPDFLLLFLLHFFFRILDSVWFSSLADLGLGARFVRLPAKVW